MVLITTNKCNHYGFMTGNRKEHGVMANGKPHDARDQNIYSSTNYTKRDIQHVYHTKTK